MTCHTREVVERSPLFWEWIDSEAALVNTDGCTWATGFYRRQCKRHDLAYRHASDPVEAFDYWLKGRVDYWRAASPVTRQQADEALRRGIWSDSPLGRFDPIAAALAVVLKAVGQRAWNKHRAREEDASHGMHG
jgi:hypothetical protein